MVAKRFIITAPGILMLAAGGSWYGNCAAAWATRLAPANVVSDSGAFSYEPYATALARYVNEWGLVDYRGLKVDSAGLDAFTASVSNVNSELYGSWSEREKTAFWINAYNAFTLEAILRNFPIQPSLVRSMLYPRNSIRQIPGVWDKLRFAVLGRQVTLDEIEHGTLRGKFNEPRIHVALVCAAMSCPPLRNEPYLAGQFQRLAR